MTDYLASDTVTKHLLLKVPDYELSVTRTGHSPTWAPGTSSLSSFIQIGDASDVSRVDGDPETGDALQGNDLIAGQLEFVDDTRYRGETTGHGDGYDDAGRATPPNETAERATASGPYSRFSGGTADKSAANPTASAAIPDYVGWRDHTDGHRITTTRGDKIEIIGGNYKLVSLGRGTGVASYEMSGGLILDGDAAPGSTTSVTWRDCPSDPGNKGWKAVEQVIKGNVVERFHGSKREEFYGNVLISVTGSPDEATTGTGLGTGKTDFSKNGEDAYVSAVADALFPAGHVARPTKWDQSDEDLPKLQKPNLYSSTWAQTVSDYTHVTGSLSETLHVAGAHSTTTRFDGSSNNTVTLNSVGEKFVERWETENSMGFFEYFQGAMTQFFLGASTTVGLANRFEVFVGVEEQFNVGGFVEIKLAADFQMTIGASMGVSAGAKLELETKSLKFWLAKEDTGLSDLETTVSSMQTTLNKNIAALKSTNSGLSKTAMWALNKL